jgi:hypothetical protein
MEKVKNYYEKVNNSQILPEKGVHLAIFIGMVNYIFTIFDTTYPERWYKSIYEAYVQGELSYGPDEILSAAYFNQYHLTVETEKLYYLMSPELQRGLENKILSILMDHSLPIGDTFKYLKEVEEIGPDDELYDDENWPELPSMPRQGTFCYSQKYILWRTANVSREFINDLEEIDRDNNMTLDPDREEWLFSISENEEICCYDQESVLEGEIQVS